MKKNRFWLIVLCLALFSCANEQSVSEKIYSSDGLLLSELFFTEAGDLREHRFYDNSGLEISRLVYPTSDTSNYQKILFDTTGMIMKISNYRGSKEIGLSLFFDEEGYVSTLDQRLVMKDVSFLNQSWEYDTLGFETGGMHYNWSIITNDTVQKDEAIEFSIDAVNPILNEEFILIDGLDDDFKNSKFSSDVRTFKPQKNTYAYFIEDTTMKSLNLIVQQIARDTLENGDIETNKIETYLKHYIRVLPKNEKGKRP